MAGLLVARNAVAANIPALSCTNSALKMLYARVPLGYIMKRNKKTFFVMLFFFSKEKKG